VAVLGGLFAVLSLLAAALLAEVLATVFFAITVAYLLMPVHRRLTGRGLSSWSASAVATAGAFFGALALLAPLGLVALLRADDLVALLRTIPDRVTIEALGYTYALTIESVLAVLVAFARDLARSAPTVVPVLLVKLGLFGLLVYALLLDGFSIRRAVLGIAPPEYRDVARALERRTRETLFAIYVLQAATAVATFLIALPVFFFLGYRYFVALSTIAAILQFIPIVGPSVLVGAIALYRVLVGDVAAGALLLVVGSVLVAWLPDVLVRPRLARETADLPGSLYFVGFVGGLLTLGPVGIIAGPLIVALVVEAADLFAIELNGGDGNPDPRSTNEHVDVDRVSHVDSGADPAPDDDVRAGDLAGEDD
jgi:predicted PurR-regulated permease PerM